VTIAEAAPFSDWQMGTGLAIPGRDSVPHFEQGPNKHGVDVHYFQTVGTRVLRGRPFAESDLVTGAEPVVIINDQAAKLLWPGEDAVGKCVRITDRGPVQPCARIVGVAEDTHASQVLERGTRAQVYMPIGMQQNSGPRAYALIVRAEDPEAIIDPMRRLMQTVLPGLPFANVRPMTAMLDEELRPWRLGATMFGVFGCIALLLAALGLYSVIAYSVAQRMHEMGVRVALGAQTGSLVRLVMRQALVLAGAGLAIGLALTLGGGKWVKPLLYEVSPREPRVLSIVAIVLLIAALTASLVPALRAGRANPIDALRSD
jgi:putative ABC transport system permease protein